MACFKQTLHYAVYHGTLASTIETCIKNVIIFAKNAKTILRQLVLQALYIYFLQFCFYITRSTLNSNNIIYQNNEIELKLFPETNSRFFFIKISENLLYL